MFDLNSINIFVCKSKKSETDLQFSCDIQLETYL